MESLPFSQAAENNREPILQQLRRFLRDAESVMEIGAGTGQHATYFASQLPHLVWRPTEQPDALATLGPRCQAAGLANVAAPVALDMAVRPWPGPWPDAIYTANTLHIVSEALVAEFFGACGEQASAGSLLLVYGPFNYNGQYTAASNERFDGWLKERDVRSGIRDFEWVDGLANAAGYGLLEDVAMPANNRLLCWELGRE